MALMDLLEESIIKVPLESDDKNGVIRELVEVLSAAGKIRNPESVEAAVLERENMGSTGLDKGIAVPHAKTTEVSALYIALGISNEGIDFEALDGESSHLFFMILAPPDQSAQHIQVLSEIAGIARSSAFCRMLTHSESAKEVMELFQEE
jgi:nitrogen PTS system EIIA component